MCNNSFVIGEREQKPISRICIFHWIRRLFDRYFSVIVIKNQFLGKMRSFTSYDACLLFVFRFASHFTGRNVYGCPDLSGANGGLHCTQVCDRSLFINIVCMCWLTWPILVREKQTKKEGEITATIVHTSPNINREKLNLVLFFAWNRVCNGKNMVVSPVVSLWRWFRPFALLNGHSSCCHRWIRIGLFCSLFCLTIFVLCVCFFKFDWFIAP